MGDKIPETLRSLLRQKLIDAVQRPLPEQASGCRCRARLVAVGVV
jgi:hypothetical protein